MERLRGYRIYYRIEASSPEGQARTFTERVLTLATDEARLKEKLEPGDRFSLEVANALDEGMEERGYELDDWIVERWEEVGRAEYDATVARIQPCDRFCFSEEGSF